VLLTYKVRVSLSTVIVMHEDTLNIIQKKKLSTGTNALIACGMQQEFASTLMLMQRYTNTTLILRAGAPPMYDRPRSPKTGLNLSKTSTQGFFKGQIPENVFFTRTKKGKDGELHAIGHHKKDTLHLEDESQNTVQLPIRLKEMIRELRLDGDLEISSFMDGEEKDEIRFKYKTGRGDINFKGEFVIKLNQKKEYDTHFSRAWDRPEFDPKFDKKKGIISKPENVKLTDEQWEKLYNIMDNNEFPLYFTNKVGKSTLHEAKVFANKEGLIVTGDWDGLTMGHPPALPLYAKKVYNTFSPDPKEMFELIQASRQYFNEMLEKIEDKKNKNETLNDLESAITKIKFKNLYTDFSLSRAGCVTPYEFMNNSIANYLYRDKYKTGVRDRSQLIGYQEAFKSGLLHARKQLQEGQKLEAVIEAAKLNAKQEFVKQNLIKANLEITQKSLSEGMQSDLLSSIKSNAIEKINQSLERTIREEYQIFILTNDITPLTSQVIPEMPHPDYDKNIENLFQHGYDMRNPYGSNLEGAWLMITEEGMIVHGNTQAQLLDIILSGDFLEKNHIDINFAADMSKGWSKVIEKQIELKQTVPQETLASLQKYYEIRDLQIALQKGIQKEVQAVATGKVIESYKSHQQNIPDDLMENYMTYLENKCLQNKPFDSAIITQIEALLTHYKEMEPTIPEAIITGYLQQIDKEIKENKSNAKELIEKVKDFGQNINSQILSKWIKHREEIDKIEIILTQDQSNKKLGYQYQNIKNAQNIKNNKHEDNVVKHDQVSKTGNTFK